MMESVSVTLQHRSSTIVATFLGQHGLGVVPPNRDARGTRPIQAFFSTDTDLSPEDILAFFVRRWQMEVTFAEVRAHLGVETQRQWSDLAILRTTPTLLGLYSLITLWATEPLSKGGTPYAAAWYAKTSFTFSDAIAAVRLKNWVGDIYSRSTDPPD